MRACVALCVCVCAHAYACAHVCPGTRLLTRTWVYLCMHQTPCTVLPMSTLSVFVSVYSCVSLSPCVFVRHACVCERGVISLCLGRGIFMLLSVPPGQMQLSCLLKRDNIPNAKLETSVSICSSAHRISISSAAKSHFTPNADRPL